MDKPVETFLLRMTPDHKETLKILSKANRRPINGEILFAIEDYFKTHAETIKKNKDSPPLE